MKINYFIRCATNTSAFEMKLKLNWIGGHARASVRTSESLSDGQLYDDIEEDGWNNAVVSFV